MMNEASITPIGNPVLTGCEGTTLNIILSSMKKASSQFINASKQPNLRHPLNENQLTQIFVEQVDLQLPSQKESFLFWKKCINAWIIELSMTCNLWQTDEILEEAESEKDFMVLKSIAHRTSENDVRLYHLWLDTR